MFLLFFILWIIYIERITTESVILGLIIAGVMYLFTGRIFDHGSRRELVIYRCIFKFIKYVAVLIKDIVIANTQVVKLILSDRVIAEPALASFTSDLKGRQSRAFYANAITLTPGTITVKLKDDRYLVHCLDREMARGLRSSDEEKILLDIERTV